MKNSRPIKYVHVTIFAFFVLNTSITIAQHEGHSGGNHKMDSTTMAPMSHAFSLGLPMNRNSSGTSWLPDSTPMFGYMLHSKKWMYMIHGNLFLRYNNQDITNKGTRGSEEWDAPNWIMAMGQKRVGKKGLFHFNTMFSLDNLITGGSGYPLLFQTGETWQGEPLVDRQHPHDLFSELSVGYSYSVNPKTDLFAYLGYPGEPSLGSGAFMHRVSSFYNPDAPLSHHWNDATHITFGVATLGLRLNKFKLEGSLFTGREPDENRYNFDKPRFDSYSARISFNPNVNWSFQVSEGFVKSPEISHPLENIFRTTASAIYSRPLVLNRFLNATALWGFNSGHANENAALLELALVLKRLALYSRFERVEKSAEDLDLHEFINGSPIVFSVYAITAGSSYDVVRSNFLNLAIGAQASLFSADSRLDIIYGRKPISAEIYARIYPPSMKTNK